MEKRDLGTVIQELKELIRLSEEKSKELMEAKVKLEYMSK